MEENRQALPQARTIDLVTQEMPDEVLIYDLKSHKAHCLNQTAAMVWKYCDGEKSIEDIAARVGKETHKPVERSVVWLALDQLQKANLLQSHIARPDDQPGISRRQAMRRLGWTTAIALPLVTTIVAPTAVSAATCMPGCIPKGPSANCGVCGPVSGTCFGANNCNGTANPGTQTCTACLGSGNSWRLP